ncbi:hypothetical protein LOK49_LG07G01028 [Camellia lanceoleosa]|uniref:Uncharacterized protein n=1 Tax=Camellia lanceoleosa TaxID=1840588 RepID=A0ACC0H465_9ERIC|nr:hypothetical protein LOK49_LG07G01028 [Camellia lanceoleosa]
MADSEVMCTKYHQERKELVQALHKDIKLSDLLKITQPMLIISGNQDQIFPLELVHRLKRYWKMEKLLFRKKLSPSDVRTCLEIPRRIALNLPKYEVEGSNGKAEMVMRVRDQTGRNWKFRRGSRRDGRGFLLKNWKKFITQHCLKVGDSVEFYLSPNPLEYECFVEFQTYERHTQYWKMEKPLFRKKLSPSDVRTCLEIPRRIALNLPKYEVEGSNGKAEMVMRVRDQTGRNWRFHRGSRRDGRGFLVKNWKKFITRHCLKVGDSVEFYLSPNPLEYECFVEFQTYERHTQNIFR